MQVTSQRASAILYNYLSGNHFDKPFLLPANVCPVVPLSFMKAGVGFEFIDIAAGCDLAAGQGAEFEICDSGVSLWIKNMQNHKNARHCLLYL